MAFSVLASLLVLAIPSYLILVRSMRYKRRDAVHAHFAYIREGEMSVEEAQRIISALMHYESPTLYYYALSFALFKTYGIPSISSLLLKTGQLGSKAWVSKRYSDTEVLVAMFTSCPISGTFNDSYGPSPSLVVPPTLGKECSRWGCDCSSDKGQAANHASPIDDADEEDVPQDKNNKLFHVDDPRANLSIARMNYLHSRYNIKNDDFLYTLALFVLEPIRWFEKWGWRVMTPLECQASFILWKDFGRRMSIQDIPETLEELSTWAEGYEKKAMKPSESNYSLAKRTTHEILTSAPVFKPFVEKVIYAFLPSRIREAFSFPPSPPRHITFTKDMVMNLHKWFLRYLCLPRRDGVDNGNVSNVIDYATIWKGIGRTRFRGIKYHFLPWYLQAPASSLSPTFWKYWLLVKLGVINEIPSTSRLRSEGYRIDEMGPMHLEEHVGKGCQKEEGKGKKEVWRMTDELLRFGTCNIPKCPVSSKEPIVDAT